MFKKLIIFDKKKTHDFITIDEVKIKVTYMHPLFENKL